jgi:hypothetical protein
MFWERQVGSAYLRAERGGEVRVSECWWAWDVEGGGWMHFVFFAELIAGWERAGGVVGCCWAENGSGAVAGVAAESVAARWSCVPKCFFGAGLPAEEVAPGHSRNGI